MNLKELIALPFDQEFTFKTSRSSGSGGQNVNKVETRVSLCFEVQPSKLLSDEQKERIIKKLESRIDKKGVLKIDVEEERSQVRNKQIAIERFFELLEKALKKKKKRKPTKISKAAKEKRLKKKKELSERKESRRDNKVK